MAVNYPSTQNTGNLIKYLQEIPSRGVPSKITIEHLISLGFKSNNDRSILGVLKFVKIIEQSGSPSDNYNKLRQRGTSKQTLGNLIRSAYSELFQLYPDACNKDVGVLKDFFATRTDGGEATLRNIVQTFQALCSIAEINTSTDIVEQEIEGEQTSRRGAGKANVQFAKGANADIHFNIQVHIPGDQKPEVYEMIFKNLGRYVLGINPE